MSTLLLRMAAPLQSWGVDSKFERRSTERMPSKSAVIGLIASALGRKRDSDISGLKTLRFGIRIDNEGVLLKDFHTAKHPYDEKRKYITNRYYLADAVFLVGLEGEMSFLTEIEQALQVPAFPLFLGRRSCPPEGRLLLGIRQSELLDALRKEPWLTSEYMKRKSPPQVILRIFMDSDEKDLDAFYQKDVPISFDQEHRQFGFRRVSEQKNPVVIINQNSYRASIVDKTNHDAFSEMEDQ